MTVKIGIIDDDQGSVQALSEYAVTLGYEVVSARDGEEGFQLFTRERPDILLLDGLLPKLHGFDLCRKIKEMPEGKETPILLISGVYKGHKYRMQSSKEYLADGYFEKPLNVQNLFTRIEDLTGNRADAGEGLNTARLHFKKLKDGTILRLLHTLYGENRTGILYLEKGNIRKSIYFKDGYISFAVSNQKEERLGELLLSDHKISPMQYSEISQTMKETGKRLGLLLLESGRIDAATLETYLQRQLTNILHSVFTWNSGYYDFVPSTDHDEYITLKAAPAQVIIRGVQKTYTAEMLERHFPEIHTVFVLSSDPRFRFQNIQLNEKEEKILSLVDGSRSVEEIVHQAQLPSVMVRKFLYALFLCRIIHKKGAEEMTEDDVDLMAGHGAEPLMDEDQRSSILRKYIQVQSQNPYEILEISKTKDKKLIKQGFMKMAKTYHPDRYFHKLDDKYNDYIKVIFQRINQVYQELLQNISKTEKETLKAAPSDPCLREPPKDESISRAENFFEKGMALSRQGDLEGAQNALISAIQVHPKETEYHIQLGLIFMEGADEQPDRLDLAESAFNYAMNLSSRDARPFFYLGCVYKVRDDTDRSEQMFSRALERDPKYIEAMREIRLIHLRKKKSIKQILQEMIGIQ